MCNQHAESRVVPRQVIDLLDPIDEALLETVCGIRPGLSNDGEATVESVVLSDAVVIDELGPLHVPDEARRGSLRAALEMSYPGGTKRPEWVAQLEASIKACAVPGTISTQAIGLTAADLLQAVLAKPCNRRANGSAYIDELRVYSRWHSPETRAGGSDQAVVRITAASVDVVTVRDALDLLAAAEGVVREKAFGKGVEEGTSSSLGRLVHRINGVSVLPSECDPATIQLRGERLEARMRERAVADLPAEQALAGMILQASDRATTRRLNDDRATQLGYLLAMGVSDQELIQMIDDLPVARTDAA